MFNPSDRGNKTLKGAGVHKSDTKPLSLWDIPLAVVLLTRLPLPHLPHGVFARQAQAVWAFPLVGILVGGLGCLVGWTAIALNLPIPACAVLLVAVLIAVTGAMHEDGLADTFDGLWGGFTPERRLDIMKDSHIGTYGVLALLLSQLIRIATVWVLLQAGAFWGILAACVFSRALMPMLMTALPNARNAGLSHSVGRPAAEPVMAGLVLATLIVVLLAGLSAVVPILCALITTAVLAAIAKAKIGGQTGDILGASQQLGELVFLLALTSLL